MYIPITEIKYQYSLKMHTILQHLLIAFTNQEATILLELRYKLVIL